MKRTSWRVRLVVLTAAIAGLFMAIDNPFPAAQAQEDKKTLRMWKAKCASCHGEDGKGATEQGQKMGVGDMTTAAFWKDLTDEKFNKAVLDGFKRTKNGKEQEMKPLRDILKPGEIDALRNFARRLVK